MIIRSQIFTPDIPVHIILHSSNSRSCFFAVEDYRYFLQSLQDHAADSFCSVHAYALMTNHVHLLLTPAHEKSVVSLISQLGESYSQYIKLVYLNCEALLGERYNCYLVHEESRILPLQRYIETKPARANIVSSPSEYSWSSYRANAHGIDLSFLTPHHQYLLLGNSRSQRQAAYRELFDHSLDHECEFLPGCTENSKYLI